MNIDEILFMPLLDINGQQYAVDCDTSTPLLFLDSNMELVANDEIDRFPCKDPVESFTKWTAQQQADTELVMQHFDGLKVSF